MPFLLLCESTILPTIHTAAMIRSSKSMTIGSFACPVRKADEEVRPLESLPSVTLDLRNSGAATVIRVSQSSGERKFSRTNNGG